MSKLTLVVAGVLMTSVATQAAITQIANWWDGDVNTPFDLTMSGTWTPIPNGGALETPPLIVTPGGYWTVQLYGQSLVLGGGLTINLLQAEAASDANPPGTASIGLLNTVLPGNNTVPPPGGLVATAPFQDAAAPVADFVLFGYVGPAGTYNWKLVGHVPEPGAYAMIAGLGLIGFAGYRRMRN